MRHVASFGSWRSPISAEFVAKTFSPFTFHLSLRSTPSATFAFWLQRLPDEGGKDALMMRQMAKDSQAVRISPKGFSVRSRVHEYGGPPYVVSKDCSTVVFSDYATNALFRLDLANGQREEPVRLTHDAKLRFADFVMLESTGKLISVVEDHREEGKEAKNYLASLDMQSGDMSVLFDASDFVASPRIAPSLNMLSFVSWDHPNMPWDKTTLHVLRLNETLDQLEPAHILYDTESSTICPTWTNTGDLLFVSDISDWWSIYKVSAQDLATFLVNPRPVAHPEVVFAKQKMEFGMPTWGLTFQTICPMPDGSILARGSSTDHAATKLCVINNQLLTEVEQPFSYLDQLSNATDQGVFAIAGSSPEQPSQMLFGTRTKQRKIELSTTPFTIVPTDDTIKIPKSMVSIPETIQFPTDNGFAFGHLYLPANGDYEGPSNELPPLLVQVHGGPTAANYTKYDPSIQYWTSRGFAVFDVNYGGSSGYGRDYRNRLNKQWGVVDVADCCNGALHLAKLRVVDRNKLLIHGGSAGGFTALACLAVNPDVFAAAASFYGVTDLSKLAEDTHKFESRYLDRLIGEYPKDKEIYDARSPIHGVDKIRKPIILFQGSEDKIVPLNQAELMHETCRKNGLDSCLVVYEGEGHSFRNPANIASTMEAELYFYAATLGFSVSVNEGIEQLVRDARGPK